MSRTYRSSDSSTYISVMDGSQELLDKVFTLLESRGFTIQTDRRILEDFPILADRHWEGAKGDLLFKSEIYPAGFRIEFHQEKSAEGKRTGYYDFDKLNTLPYLSKCEYLVARKYIRQLLEDEGFNNTADPEFKHAIDNVMYAIKSCCHYKEGKELPEYEHPSYNAKDRDDKKLYNGQIKYYRDRKGRLMRGEIYHNINNMWWVVLNKDSYTNEAASRLFDITTEEDLIPKIYSRKIPYRIKAEKAREIFNKKFDYSVLRETHIGHLRLLVSHELATHDAEMDMSIKTPLKKDMKVLKTKGLIHANIKVNGSYFDGREAITFNKGGFIGFAGWASGYNIKPFVEAFEKWMDWLDEVLAIEKISA